MEKDFIEKQMTVRLKLIKYIDRFFLKSINLIIILFFSFFSFGQASCVPEINGNSGYYYFYRIIPVNQTPDDTIKIYLPKDSKTENGLFRKHYNRVEFDSLISGNFKVYSSDSLILRQVITIKNGRKNGLVIDYFENGTLKSKIDYLYNEPSDYYLSYTEFGKILMHWQKINDQIIGKSYTYWNNKNVASETIFDGKSNWNNHEVNYWNQEGEKIDKITFNSLWYPCK